jgi:O-antigen ligase
MGRMLNSDGVQRRGTDRAANNAERLPPTNSRPLKPAALTKPRALPAEQIGHARERQPNALQRLAFLAGLATIFVKLTVLPELLVTFLHVNTYLLWIVSPPALFGALFTGGVGRTLQHRAGRLFLAFFFWMMISLPFSSWPGGSIGEFRVYAQNSFALLFVVAGLTLVWSEVRTTFVVIGAAGVFIIGAARFLALTGDSGRLEMSGASTTIGNENDLASHLLFVLPFVLYLALDQRINRALRVLMVLPMAFGVWVIFATASRGGLVSLFVCFLFVLFRGSARQRMAALIIGGVMALAIPILLSGSNAADRLGSLFGGQHEEAKESGDSREYLLRQSISYTISHPLFGVGMSQFGNYEGGMSVRAGVTGNWHETHNSLTQVSSECGVPALIFFVMAISGAIVSVNRIYGQARRQGYTEIANAGFCYLLAAAGYLTSVVFLSNAYRFYLPIMVGLGVAFTLCAQREMSQNPAANPRMPTGWIPPIPPRRRVAQP